MIRLIVATDPNGVIGVKYMHYPDPDAYGYEADGSSKWPIGGRPRYWQWAMPWHYKQDLRRFKKTTMGGVLVMGRRTFESLPGVLPGRPHLLLTRDDGFFQNEIFKDEKASEQVGYRNSFDEMMEAIGQFNGRDIWIAGGNEIYKLFLEAGCVEEIDHTIVPEVKFDAALLERLKHRHPNAEVVEDDHFMEPVTFDLDALDDFELVAEVQNPLDERLTHRRFKCPLPDFKS